MALSAVRPFITSRRRPGNAPDRRLSNILNRYAVVSGVVVKNDEVYCLGACDAHTMFRTASITKMVTAIGALTFANKYHLSLDAPVTSYATLPLKDITLRQLLSHTSGIRDGALYTHSLLTPVPLNDLLQNIGDDTSFSYSNLGFGVIGSIIEMVTGESYEKWMQENVFHPLDIACTYDLLAVPHLNNIYRVVPPKKAFDALKRRKQATPIINANPQFHYHLAAGCLYANAVSLGRILRYVAGNEAMIAKHASYGALSPNLAYGLGTLIVSDKCLYGHQGFAYGAVNGAFVSSDGKQFLVSLNNGASEERDGRMACLNRDLIKWAFGKE